MHTSDLMSIVFFTELVYFQYIDGKNKFPFIFYDRYTKMKSVYILILLSGVWSVALTCVLVKVISLKYPILHC